MPTRPSTSSSSSSSSSSPDVPPPTMGRTREVPLQPPKPLFFIDHRQAATESTEEASRDPFRTPEASIPGTPKNVGDNPFSPPSSVISFSGDNIIPGNGGHLGEGSRSSSVFSDRPMNRNLSSRVSVSSGLRNPVVEGSIQETTRASLPHVNSGIRSSYMSPAVLSRRTTVFESSEIVPRMAKRARSTMLTSEIEKPWLTEKDAYSRLSYFLTYAMMFLGIAGGAVRCYFGWKDIPRLGNICLVMEDDFNSLDTNVWYHEVDMGGFGNGEFEMTTTSSNNSFVEDGRLYIVPTLTSDVIGYDNVMNGYMYNVSGCTSANLTSCGTVSNSTAGTVINPVMSARLSTLNSYSIQYGKVEVVAKIPTGDWLWPAIWMLPVKNTYGPWPASGEIDIMEARGNGISYPAQGVNYVRGSLNWGPTSWLNSVYKTYGWWTNRRSTFADNFHTYTVEWSPKFVRIYVDTRLDYMLDLSLNEPFFKRGDYPETILNGSQYIVTPNPWEDGTPNVAPFDQPFYLILNVAVGGTNGWFPDNVGNKPWLDGSLTAMRDFAAAQNTWSQTWPSNYQDRALVVDSVKMWEMC
ncbi:glycoside hydrolase family 16 protein [Sparassis crispa]|uniref:Glycoside hydrolase family 16 protein n=1 Tax=Sparassis crispa TaxID=139825 RepID=A0A401GTX2_9APHY|nr:glycoside hydrolase family 16 protein [Sparassis crispa]GBE85656.1 glycoside hydrolase family 16 protein [Sparassis crispa]